MVLRSFEAKNVLKKQYLFIESFIHESIITTSIHEFILPIDYLILNAQSFVKRHYALLVVEIPNLGTQRQAITAVNSWTCLVGEQTDRL